MFLCDITSIARVKMKYLVSSISVCLSFSTSSSVFVTNASMDRAFSMILLAITKLSASPSNKGKSCLLYPLQQIRWFCDYRNSFKLHIVQTPRTSFSRCPLRHLSATANTTFRSHSFASKNPIYSRFSALTSINPTKPCR